MNRRAGSINASMLAPGVVSPRAAVKAPTSRLQNAAKVHPRRILFGLSAVQKLRNCCVTGDPTEDLNTGRNLLAQAALEDAQAPVMTPRRPRQAGLEDGSTPEQSVQAVPKAGAEEDERWFDQHWSVQYWRQLRNKTRDDMFDYQELATSVASAVQQANALQDPTSAAYWAYHIARWGYFFAQGAGSVLISSARSGQLAKGQIKFITGPLDSAGAVAFAWVWPYLLHVSEDSFAMFQCDLRNIKEGVYKLPWDMTFPGHRQFNPVYALRQSLLYLQEAPAVLDRQAAPEGKVGVLPFLKSPMYPGYYHNNFHFQTDGWLSSRSAETYDVATETLFSGRQDAMQRGVLLALSRHLPGSNGAGLEMLEVGAGTGRFATFVRDNYPAASLTVSDLSPFYLQKARDNMAYWERCTKASVRSTGRVAFLQCAAEALPQAAGSLDVVYALNVFHELPDDVRRAALREFARVLKPGGIAVVSDSIQHGDRHASLLDIRFFGSFNEPHYLTYLDFNFGREFDAAGLQPDFKSTACASKVLSAVKR